MDDIPAELKVVNGFSVKTGIEGLVINDQPVKAPD
jgi:hypothetical protein